MVTISLCMIVKDEEDVLERCLASVKDLVDEINIVDTGSTDQTKDIAAQYTDRVFDFEWIDDFASARNFAFQKATQDYILWLDADDVLLEMDQEKFAQLKRTLDDAIDVVTMDYHLGFDEFGNETYSVKRNRLLKREKQFRWIGAVHEYIEVEGSILSTDIAITHHSLYHDSDRNLKIYEKQLALDKKFTPRDLYYFANELSDHRMYERAIYFYEKFLATEMGWIEDNIAACGKLADCYFELGNPKKQLQSIFRSFIYDRPRPEFCCRIGYHFLQNHNYKTALFWYMNALETSPSSDGMGFVNLACSTWLPHLQICICYDRLGDYESAYRHNELARMYRPNDASILHNKQYLESVMANDTTELSGDDVE